MSQPKPLASDGIRRVQSFIQRNRDYLVSNSYVLFNKGTLCQVFLDQREFDEWNMSGGKTSATDIVMKVPPPQAPPTAHAQSQRQYKKTDDFNWMRSFVYNNWNDLWENCVIEFDRGYIRAIYSTYDRFRESLRGLQDSGMPIPRHIQVSRLLFETGPSGGHPSTSQVPAGTGGMTLASRTYYAASADPRAAAAAAAVATVGGGAMPIPPTIPAPLPFYLPPISPLPPPAVPFIPGLSMTLSHSSNALQAQAQERDARLNETILSVLHYFNSNPHVLPQLQAQSK
jgi:hypothetical protein